MPCGKKDCERILRVAGRDYSLPEVEELRLNNSAVHLQLGSKEDAQRAATLLAILFGVPKP